MSDTLIKVEGVSKKYCRSLKKSLWYGMQDLGREITGQRHGGNGELRPDEFWAVKDVNFELKRGECLGLVGHNGAGKTTLLKMLNGLVKPDAGQIQMRGRVGAIIALGAGFNPILTGRENIYVNASVLGLTKQEIDHKVDEIIEFSEIKEYIDMPVQSYSSGMSVRLGFSIATSIKTDVLILDEVLAVGDENFQAKCFKRIGELLADSAVILVSHQAHHIKKNCDTALLLERGQCITHSSPDNVLKEYKLRTNKISSEPLTILGNSVSQANLSIFKDKVETGDFLELDLSIYALEEFVCDQAYLNIVDLAGVVHAQCHLGCLHKEYAKGSNRLLIKVGPLFLSAGQYSGNFVMYGGGGKQTIAHLRHALSFTFAGPPNLGPVYYPPASAKEI